MIDGSGLKRGRRNREWGQEIASSVLGLECFGLFVGFRVWTFGRRRRTVEDWVYGLKNHKTFQVLFQGDKEKKDYYI
jgi:hypothetical protein